MKDKTTGREIIRQVTFKQESEDKDGAFVAINKARERLQKEGYIIGSMCLDEPIGFAKKEETDYVAKWRNIPTREYPRLAGTITSDDLKGTRRGFRDGHVTINYFGE